MNIKEAIQWSLVIWMWVLFICAIVMAMDTIEAWHIALESQAKYVQPPDNTLLRTRCAWVFGDFLCDLP